MPEIEWWEGSWCPVDDQDRVAVPVVGVEGPYAVVPSVTWDYAAEKVREQHVLVVADAVWSAYVGLRRMVLDEYPKDETIVSVIDTWGVGLLSEEERRAVRTVEATLSVVNGGAEPLDEEGVTSLVFSLGCAGRVGWRIDLEWQGRDWTLAQGYAWSEGQASERVEARMPTAVMNARAIKAML